MTRVMYKATESTGQVQPFQSRYSRAFEIACAALSIVREHGKIPRQDLIRKIIEQKGNGIYSRSTLATTLIASVSGALAEQGLLKRIEPEETISEEITSGYLTRNQFYNYLRLSIKSGVFVSEGDRRKDGKMGVYSKEEIAVLRSIGELVSYGIYPVHAIEFSVREVLGDDRLNQFKEYYRKNVKQRAAHQKDYRAMQRAEHIRSQKAPKLKYPLDFDAALKLYDDSAYRNPPDTETRAFQTALHDGILEQLVRNHSTHSYRFTKRYPFNLYFALSEPQNDPRTRGTTAIREGLDVTMQTAPQQEFSSYEAAILRNLNSSLDQLAGRIVAYLNEGFAEARREIAQLDSSEEIRRLHLKIRGLRRAIEIVEERYGRGLLTLQQIGDKHSVERERIRQLEERGLKLLRQQPAIQNLLSYRFCDIPQL